MPALFIPNRNFTRDFIKERSGEQGLKTAAELVKGIAEAKSTPIMPSGRPSVVEVQADEQGVRVVRTDHGGHLDEWGSAKNPPVAPLRTAVREVGLRLEEH